MNALPPSSPAASRSRSQQINLLDASLLPTRDRLNGVTLLALMGVGLTGVVLHYAIEKYRLQSELALITMSAPRAANLGAASAPGEAPPNDKAQQLARADLLRNALTQGSDLPSHAGEMVNDVARALPDTVWLSELQILGEHSITLSGGSLERAALVDFSQALEARPSLRGIPIGLLKFEPRTRAAGDVDGGSLLADATEGGAGGAAPAALSTRPTHFAFTMSSRPAPSSSNSGAGVEP